MWANEGTRAGADWEAVYESGGEDGPGCWKGGGRGELPQPSAGVPISITTYFGGCVVIFAFRALGGVGILSSSTFFCIVCTFAGEHLIVFHFIEQHAPRLGALWPRG